MKQIVTTGYGWSGSGAVLDLLKEYNCCKINEEYKGKYEDREHILLQMPHGLFDLERNLLSPHDMHGADEALYLFQREMKKLNDIDGIWYGEYKKYFGSQFGKIVGNFIKSLDTGALDCSGIHQSYLGNPAVLSNMKRLVTHPRQAGMVNWKRRKIKVRSHGKMQYAFPDQEQFLRAGKQFIYDYVRMIYPLEKYHSDYVILDHLCRPHCAAQLCQYVDHDFFILIVGRDVRDIYCFVKESQERLPYPKDVRNFVRFYRGMHQYDDFQDERILYVQFEDLIFHYADEVSRIEEFLGIPHDAHTAARKYFNPRISKKNCGRYQFCSWGDEIKYIERELPEYCYDAE